MNGATWKTEVNGGFKEAQTLKQVNAEVFLRQERVLPLLTPC